MIGKIILMQQPHARQHGVTANQDRAAHLRDTVFALTRYVVDANPHELINLDGGILALTDYALAMKDAGAEPGEKVEAYGARNLVGASLPTWQAQMLAVASRAPKMKAPVAHIIMSLHEEERWTEHQREEAITIVLQTLGLERCQTVWAEHSNTRNPHIHLSVVRVDPETGKAAGSDWLIDDLHQALALIEERQGRLREPNALYFAKDGVVYDRETGRAVRNASNHYVAGGKSPAADRERIPEGLRPLREILIAKTREARSWSDLHDSLRAIGMTYDKAGNGAHIKVEGKCLKASSWHRSLGRLELEKRLGPFTPDRVREDPGYIAYLESVAALTAALRSQRDADCDRINRWLKASLKELRHESQPIAIAMRAEAKEALASLRKAYSRSIATQACSKIPRDAWIKAGRPRLPEMADAPALILAAGMDGIERSWTLPTHLTARHSSHATEYLDRGGRAQFTDHRVLIIVHASKDIAAIDAALQIGAERWGSIRIRGSEQFCTLATQRAKLLGINVLEVKNSAPPSKQPAPAPTETKSPAPSSADRAEPTPPLRTEAPKPEITSKQNSATAAKEKEAARDNAKAILSRFESVPLQREVTTQNGGATERGGKLKINLEAVTDPVNRQLLSLVAKEDQDTELQSLLEAMRKRQLERWGEILRGIKHIQPEGSQEDPIRSLPLSEQAAANSAREDRDWLDLLAAWRQRNLAAHELTKKADHKPQNVPEFEDDGLELILEWQRRNGLGR